jgi:hypothetical protein
MVQVLAEDHDIWSLSLTTLAHYQGNLGLFKAPPAIALLQGLPPLCQRYGTFRNFLFLSAPRGTYYCAKIMAKFLRNVQGNCISHG